MSAISRNKKATVLLERSNRERVLGDGITEIMESQEIRLRHSHIEKLGNEKKRKTNQPNKQNKKIVGQNTNRKTRPGKCQRNQEKKVLQVKIASSSNKKRTEKQYWIE